MKRRPHSPDDMQRVRDRDLLRAQIIPPKDKPAPEPDEWDDEECDCWPNGAVRCRLHNLP